MTPKPILGILMRFIFTNLYICSLGPLSLVQRIIPPSYHRNMAISIVNPGPKEVATM